MCFSPSATAKRECPKCGAEQSVQSAVCTNCGYEFPEAKRSRRMRVCPECGAENPMTNRKCDACGVIFKAAGRRAGGPSGPR